MAETLTIRTASSTEVVKIAVPGPQGPKGDKGDPGDVAGLPLSTLGDTLYRGASENQRLPIGTSGQILRVSAGGIPEWGAAPATGVTSVALASTDLTITGSPITTSGTITANIAANAVTLEKLQTISSQHLLGRHGNGNGGVQQIGLGTGLAMSGSNIQCTVIAPTASSATPSSLGTASSGSSSDYARADHVHSAEVNDSAFRVLGSTDATKKVAIEVDTNVPSGQTVTLAAPSSGGTIALAGAAPAAHAASHATGGTDALAPSDIGAQSVFSVENLVITTSDQVNLTAARAKIYDIVQYAGAAVDVKLPSTNALQGDVIVLRWATGSDSINVIQSSTPAQIGTVSYGEQKRFIRGATDSWTLVPVDTHSHSASAITSGTLDNARVNWAAPSAIGSTTAAAATVTDLKADTLTIPKSGQPTILANVSSGNLSATGQISAATLTTATGGSVIVASGGALRLESGAAVVDPTDTTKKLALNLSGIPTGTTRTLTVSTSGDIHAQSHAITSTSDHTAGNNKVFYSNSSGQITELALGAANTVLTSNGTTSAPSFAAVSAGATNLWIPASAWIPRTTTGCGVDSTELSTNKVNTDQLLFDTATEEYAQALVMMPSNYNYGTVTARFYWTASSGSGGVAFGLRGRAYADDDALDQAQGTGQVTTDTFIVADDLHVTAATSAITLAGTPAANRPVQLEIYRQVSNASDTLGVDARLLGVEVIFN